MRPAFLHEDETAQAAGEHPQFRLLGAPEAHVAVLDLRGTILRVNRAWLRFALLNGDPPIERIGAGASYLQVCERAAAQGDLLASEALDGLCAVLLAQREHFSMEYPCHAPEQERWFRMLVSRGRGGHVLVAHEQIVIPLAN